MSTKPFSTTTLVMKRHFDVKAERLYDAWLNPQMMRKWLFTMDASNKVCVNDPRVGGEWEIVDHRGGVDYRAVGNYVELTPPSKIVLTFRMPQFSDTEDVITVEIEALGDSCEMTFTQEIVVPHEEGWTADDVAKALGEYRDGTEHGFSLMFGGLKQLLEQGITPVMPDFGTGSDSEKG